VTCNANSMIGDGVLPVNFHWLKHFKVKTWLVLPKTKTETKRGQDLVWFKDISVSQSPAKLTTFHKLGHGLYYRIFSTIKIETFFLILLNWCEFYSFNPIPSFGKLSLMNQKKKKELNMFWSLKFKWILELVHFQNFIPI